MISDISTEYSWVYILPNAVGEGGYFHGFWGKNKNFWHKFLEYLSLRIILLILMERCGFFCKILRIEVGFYTNFLGEYTTMWVLLRCSDSQE